MRYKIKSEKEKLVIVFTNSRSGINKAAICHIKDTLSLWYGKIEMSGDLHEVYPDYIIITIIPFIKEKEEIREILNFAKTFLIDFLIPEAVRTCKCCECITKKQPSFCIHKMINKNKIAA